MSSDLFKNPYKKKGPALKFKSKSGQKKNITNNEISYNKPDFKLGDEPGIVKEKPKSKPSGNKNNLTIITICVVISTISICFYVAYNIYKDYRNNKEVQKYVEEANNIIENFNSETKKYTSSLKPNANTAKEIHEFKQATHISVNPYNFVPVNMKVGPKHNPFNSPLTYTKPKEIFHEPLYRGKQQLYGILKLGSNRNYVFPFVFDVYSSEKMVLYFDTNKNGDLTDDGRLINKGTGRFASYIKIPWNKLINNCPYKGNFLIWFYINSAGWKKGRLFSHYSRTQLEGNVYIKGTPYKAYLVDRNYNDADLFNDGICIDINRNGKIEREEMYKDSVIINDTKFVFNVKYQPNSFRQNIIKTVKKQGPPKVNKILTDTGDVLYQWKDKNGTLQKVVVEKDQ